MDSMTVDECVEKYGSVMSAVKAKIQELENIHGQSSNRGGGLNYDFYEFKDGYLVKISCSYGVLTIEEA